MAVSTLGDIQTLEDYLNTEEKPLPAPFKNAEKISEAFSGSTFDAIQKACSQYSNKTALSFFLNGNDYKHPTRISYSEFGKKLRQTVNLFNTHDLGKGDVIAYVLPNLPETHYVLWGGEGAATVLAINPLLEASQMKELLEHSNAKAIVTLSPFPGTDLWQKVSKILPELPAIQTVFQVDPAHHAKGIKSLAAKAIQLRHHQLHSHVNGKQLVRFQSALDKQPDDKILLKRSIQPNETASLFCTGGTTGLPKIATHSHGNELANAKSIALIAEGVMSPGKVILCGLPLFHVNAAIVTGLTAFVSGCEVVLMTPQGYRGENVFPNFWNIIDHYRVNSFSGVPTVYSTLLQQSVGGANISSLEMALCGAAPMPVEVFNAFEKVTGVQIIEGYGLTEGTCASSITPIHGKKKVGSIGIRLPTQRMESVQLDDQGNFLRLSDTNEVGALVINGDNVFSGYLNEKHNQGIWVTDGAGKKWLNTGDLGRQDEDGYFWLTGRKKELIVRGGHNIEPKLIEETLCKHDSVALAAAVGCPDAHAGEVPVAYVALTQSAAENLDIENEQIILNKAAENLLKEITQFANQNITERAAIPKRIELCTALPTTAVGKVFKPQLEMQEIKLCVESIIGQLLTSSETPLKSPNLTVQQDKVLGMIAKLDCRGESLLQDQMKERLAPYTFKYEVNL